MARFFFHIHECGTVISDEEGIECDALDTARDEAIRGARALMCMEMEKGHLCLSCQIEVQNEAGVTVLTVPFKAAVAVTGI